MIKNSRKSKVYSDLSALSRDAASIFVASALRAVAERGRFCVCLSGGSTPGEMSSRIGQGAGPEQGTVARSPRLLGR